MLDGRNLLTTLNTQPVIPKRYIGRISQFLPQLHGPWLLSRVSTLTRHSNSVPLSVCLSVRPSVSNVLVLDENGLTYCHSFFHNFFTSIKHLHEIPTRSPTAGALNTDGVYKFRDFLPISRYISQTIQDIAIVTMEGE